MPRVPKETLIRIEDPSDGTPYSSPCGDLRRAGTQYKRVHDQKSKWALGNRLEQVCWIPLTFNSLNDNVLAGLARQPRKPYLAMSAEPGFEKMVNRQTTARKRLFRYDVEQVLKDDMESDDCSAYGDEPEAPIASDHPQYLSAMGVERLPTAGYEVLASATDAAVRRHEQEADKRERREMSKHWDIVSPDEDLYGVNDRDLGDDDYLLVETNGRD
ncbi:hypothetical protein KEM56_001288 [Ascosphaera pollenicola]|nr:hypothetical protein KEM56_001288 [Ascosphaera pollenicola]